MQKLGHRDGTRQAQYSLEQKNGIFTQRKTFEDVIYVLSDDLDQDEDDIKAFQDVPEMGELRNGASVRKVTPKELMTVVHPITGVKCILWEVEVQYDSAIDPANDGGGTPGNIEPKDMRPLRKWSTRHEKALLTRDQITGEPIVTQADEPIAHQTTIGYPILQITRYEDAPFDPLIKYNYENFTNQSEFYGAPSGCALMKEINSEEVVVDGRLYCQVTYVVEFSIYYTEWEDGTEMLEDGYMLRLLHQGYMYRADSSPNSRPVLNIGPSGQPERVNLKTGEGNSRAAKILDGGGGKLAADADPNYLEFNEFAKRDFSVLALEY